MQDNKLTLPIAIIIAGALIGGAVIYTRGAPSTNTNPANTDTTKTTTSPKPPT